MNKNISDAATSGRYIFIISYISLVVMIRTGWRWQGTNIDRYKFG